MMLSSVSSLALLMAATTTFAPLHSPEAMATSFLKSNWNRYEENYHPSYVLDGDPKTAWVEGVDGDGVGEQITLPLSTVSSARTLKLRFNNGYQKNKDLLTANGAPKQVTIIVLDVLGTETAKQTATLTRTMGPQDVLVPLNGQGVAAVTVVIDSVEPGRVYKDTCISDIAVFVDSDVPWNAKAEQEKKKALAAWKKERLATARFFAKLPKTWPWKTTTYDTTGRSLAHATYTDGSGGFAPAYASVTTMLAAKLPVLAPLTDVDRADLQRLVGFRDGERSPASVVRRVEPTNPQRPPDGLFMPAGFSKLLLKNDLSFAEPATATKQTRSFIDQHGTRFGTTTTGDAIVDGNDVLLPVITVRTERVTTTTTAWWLLRYDDTGRLATLGVVKEDDDGSSRVVDEPTPQGAPPKRTSGEAFELYRFSWNAAGKVEAIDGLIGRVSCGPDWLDAENDDPAVAEAASHGCVYRVSSRKAVPYTGP